jgi:hypothetical protein
MRGLIALTVIVFLCYFGWFYLPEDVKDTVREFRKTHLFKMICLIFAILLAFMMQATFGSGKIF